MNEKTATSIDVELKHLDLELKKLSVKEQKVRDRPDRRMFFGLVLLGLAVVVIIVTLFAFGSWNVQQDRVINERKAKACIAAGNIWTAHGDCLVTRNVPRS